MYNHCLLNVIHHHQKQTCQSNEDLSSHVLLKYFITCNSPADACQTTHFVNSITTQMAQSPLGLTLEPNHSGSIRELMATWARQLQALPLPRKKYLFVVDSLDKSDDVVWGLWNDFNKRVTLWQRLPIPDQSQYAGQSGTAEVADPNLFNCSCLWPETKQGQTTTVQLYPSLLWWYTQRLYSTWQPGVHT